MSRRRDATDHQIDEDERPAKYLKKTSLSRSPALLSRPSTENPVKHRMPPLIRKKPRYDTSEAATLYGGQSTSSQSPELKAGNDGWSSYSTPQMTLNHVWQLHKKRRAISLEYKPLADLGQQEDGIVDSYLKLSRMYGGLRSIRLPNDDGVQGMERFEPGLPSVVTGQRSLIQRNQVDTAPSKNTWMNGTSATCQQNGQNLGPQGLPWMFGTYYSRPITRLELYLEEFFVRAFCPGRTIKEGNNPWLRHIVPMQKHESVVTARLALSAIYVNDLTKAGSTDNMKMKQVMQTCESKTLERLAAIEIECEKHKVLPTDLACELLAIFAVTIQFDLVHFERADKISLPERPIRSWLVQYVLEQLRRGKIDVGRTLLPEDDVDVDFMPPAQHYDRIHEGHKNYQFGPFVLEMSLMAARQWILAQPLEDLRSKPFDARLEQTRFDWLLHGSRSEAHQISPILGFSRRLLHYTNYVTYLAHGMLLGKAWRRPKFADAILEALGELKQWSKDYTTEATAMNNSFPIERIRLLDAEYKTESPAEMTSWTAEAWRFAVIAYCQCRLFRLPRNHPQVVATLEDLHHCIRVLPTGGNLFTTEAPLYPVFLLGLLSTKRTHRTASQMWMREVTRRPERSTARPLRTALDKIWHWIDVDERFTPLDPTALAPQIWDRTPWWEQLVHDISRAERRHLSLT